MKRVLLALALLCGVALSHSEPFEVTPANGARVKTPPQSVTITFDEAIEGAFSAFKVYAYTGEVTKAKLQAFAKSKTALKNDEAARADVPVALGGTTKTVTLKLKPGLKPGVYVVMWRVLGVDTHTVEAHTYFRYLP
jgi:methionine-rich copper-binding protein CopC